MLPTTKDPYSAAATVQEAASSSTSGDAGNSGNSGQTQRRTDAVGAEIPVVVHASRYSSASLGVGKNLSPVHEETRTVIVFPNGAVVRISANMAVGELVVLTNQQTGADVICKVINVKAQPGIQNYVNLEFTQRAPSFWDASSLSGKTSRPESMLPVSASLPAPSAAETRLPSPQSAAYKSLAPTPSTTVPANFSVAPASPASTENWRGSAVLSGSHLGTESSLNERPRTASTDAAQIQNWARLADAEARTTNGLSGPKRFFLIAGSTVLLLSLGAAGGVWLFRNARSSASTTQVPANSSEQSVPLPAVTTDQEAALPQQDTAPEPGSLQSAVISSANGQPNAPVAQPAASRSSSEPSDENPIGQSQSVTMQPARSPNIAVEKLAAPVAKSRIAGESPDAPPLVAGQAGGLADASAIDNAVYGEAPRVRAPAVPTHTGGQIQPAKPLSSPAPAYPLKASGLHIEGVVTIDAELDDTGKVVQMKVISGPPELQQAAMDALRKWKYQPAMLDGRPIVSHTEVSLNFHLLH